MILEMVLVVFLLGVIFILSPLIIDLVWEAIDAWKNLFKWKRPFD